MFWNRISGIYDFVENTFNGKVNKDIAQYVANLMTEDDNVLECACGTGMFSLPIARRCKSLAATDVACLYTIDGSPLWQVATGGATAYDCPWRLIGITDQGLNIETHLTTNLPGDHYRFIPKLMASMYAGVE